jgi:putative hydrolase of the HAD superfamily
MVFSGKDIQCVTFDLDDTLWLCAPVVHNAEFVFYMWLEEKFPNIAADFDISTLTLQRRDFFAQFPEMAHDFSWLRHKWLGQLFEDYEVDSLHVEEGFNVYLNARNDIVLFDGAQRVLEKVSKRYLCGSITNGNADVELIGIGDYFDFSITAAGAGAAKPSPVIFDAAVAAAGVSPEQILHIGDDPDRDMRGAAAAGMQTLWVNPQGMKWKGRHRPGGQIRMISELGPLLDS